MINMNVKTRIVNGVMHKQCSVCKKFKPLDEYHKFKHGAFGVTSGCKECISISGAKWRKSHPEYIENCKKNENSRYKTDPAYRERKIQYCREWRKTHPEYSKEWTKKNLEYCREYQRNYQREHQRNYQREYQREWRKTHPDYYRKIQAKRKEMKQKS